VDLIDWLNLQFRGLSILLNNLHLLVIHSRIIQHYCKLAARIVKRPCNEICTLPHSQSRGRPVWVVTTRILVDQGDRKTRPENRVLVFRLEHRECLIHLEISHDFALDRIKGFAIVAIISALIFV
jgi:hypothetical protein